MRCLIPVRATHVPLSAVSQTSLQESANRAVHVPLKVLTYIWCLGSAVQHDRGEPRVPCVLHDLASLRVVAKSAEILSPLFESQLVALRMSEGCGL